LLELMRHYALPALLVVLLTTSLGTAAATALAARSPYEATALVIARDLNIEAAALARFGESVFMSGSVAREVARTQGLSQDNRTLVPEVIDVDPVAESISFLVRGRADDPVQAAATADAAARAFVRELNRAGAGVGDFVLQDLATEPLFRQVRGPGPLLGGLASLVAGTLLAVVAVWVLYGLRRPVLAASDAAVAADAPLVAQVRLPRGGAQEPQGFPGLRRLLRWLGTAAAVDHLALVGTARSAPVRRALAAALPSGPGVPRLVAPPGPDDDDLLMDRHRISALIVVEVGTPAPHVAAVRAELGDDEVLGVVLVDRRRRGWTGRRDRKRIRRGGGAPVATRPSESGRAVGWPSESGRAVGSVPTTTSD
jgi:hypothetical protein